MSEYKYTERTAEEILDEMLDEDAWITSLERVQLEAVRAELERLRNEVVQIHTYIECVNPACKRGVRPRDAVCGLCPACAEDDLTRLRRIERAVMDIMDGFDHKLPEVILWWRTVARDTPRGVGRVFGAIANALEANP